MHKCLGISRPNSCYKNDTVARRPEWITSEIELKGQLELGDFLT